MSRQHTRFEAGPALARAVRVSLRIACVLVLLLGATAAAQPASEQPAAAADAPGFGAPRDTLIMRQVQEESGWWDTLTSITGGLVSIVAVLLLAVLIPVVWALRNVARSAQRTVEKLQGDLAPLVQHANSIADDVNYISTSVRADVQRINQTVATANRQLLDAVKKAEERVDEFNALLAVAQEEAEDAFISTAAALRGISSGAAALAGVERGRRRRGPRRARRESDSDRDLRDSMAELRAAIDADLQDAVNDVGPALEDSFAEEEADGDDGSSTTDGGRAAPSHGKQRPGNGNGRGSGEGGTV